MYTVLLWVELHVDMLLTKGVVMERYTGPTLLTYEEWWKWESKRLRDGKVPSRRVASKHCAVCHKPVSGYYDHYCGPQSTTKQLGLNQYDKITISYPRKGE